MSHQSRICANDAFGPWAGPGCRGGFDFTLFFEDSILSIPLSSVFIIVSLFRIVTLFKKPEKVKSGTPLDWAKKAASVCFVALSAALAGLWGINNNASDGSGIPNSRATIPSSALMLVVSLLFTILSSLEHRASPKPSFITSVYLGLAILFDTSRARTLWMLQNADRSPIPAVFSASLGLKVLMLLLESAEKRGILIEEYRKGMAEEMFSGPYNRGIFWWLKTVFVAGYNRVIGLEDCYELAEDMKAKDLSQKLSAAWKECSNKTSPGALFGTWVRTFTGPLLASVIPKLFTIGFTYAQPFLITAAIQLAYMPDAQPYNNHGYGLIGAYIIVYAGVAVANAQYEWRISRAASILRGSIVPLIYEKSLRLDSGSSTTVSPQDALTLVNTDIETMAQCAMELNETWSNLLEIGIAIYLISRQLGAACAISVGFSIVVMIGGTFLAVPTGKQQANWIQASQTRVSATSKTLGNIKWLKISGLTRVAFDKIRALRAKELSVSEKFRYLIGGNLLLSFATPILGPLLTFATFAGIALHSDSTTFTISKVFTAYSIIALLNMPLAKIVQALGIIASGTASFQRVQNHLNKAEREDPRYGPYSAGEKLQRDGKNPDDGYTVPFSIGSPPEMYVAADPGTIVTIYGKYYWPEESSVKPPGSSDTAVLEPKGANPKRAVIDISEQLRIPRGSFTMVLGPVGCGKSTFLKAILGELSDFDGLIGLRAPSGVSYCSQTPWLPNDTVRNLILGTTEQSRLEGLSEADESWYRKVIAACALEQDIASWPHGEHSSVGPKGISMSGGQKQRLSIARAVYARRNLVVLDDVFSSLDAKTEAIIFDNLLGYKGLLRQANTTVILASSDSRRVTYADQVFVMSEDGQFKRIGDREGIKKLTTFSPPDTDQHESQDAPPKKLETGAQTNQPQLTPTATRETIAKTEAEANTARQMGDTAVYKFYIQSAGWVLMTGLTVVILLYAFFGTFPTIWLKWWSEANEEAPDSNLGKWLGGYTGLSVGAITFCAISCWLVLIVVCTRSGIYFHDILVNTVSRASMAFHSAVDTGITVNRFSQDLALIDMELPMAAFGTVMSFAFGIAEFVMVCVSTRYMAALLPVILGIMYLIQHVYLRTARQMRFLDIECKAPLYSHLIDTLTGLPTIRAFHWEDQSIEKGLQILDASQRPNYLMYCIQRWLIFAVNMMVMLLAVVLIILVTTLREQIGPGYAGVALSNLIAFGGTVQATIVTWVMLEVSLGAVARVRSFEMEVKSEDEEARERLADAGRKSEVVEPSALDKGEKWPSKGCIEIQDLSASYPTSGRVLNSLTLTIQPGQKVGVCGRTGSGKSSLIMSLLGLMEQDSGSIVIDGVDLATLPREYIREHLVVLPQESIILAATLRENVCPSVGGEEYVGNFEERDKEIIRVLERVGLWKNMEPRGGLNAIIDDTFLSQGQNQLLALARAMMRQDGGRVLVLDEATSSLDDATTTIIDDVIRTWFKDWTVLAIVHKFSSILDFDLVAVLDAGRLVEFDNPSKLLSQDASVFKDLYETREG